VSTPGHGGGAVGADVAIVGAGPVGLVLGIQLAQHGRSVAVLEQWPDPYPLPRAVHFDHEVGRIIQSCGIGDEVRAISEPAGTYEWRNGQGTTLLRFGRDGAAMSGWPFSSMFCQPELEALLQGRVASLPTLEVLRGVRACGIDQHDDHVVIHHVPVQAGPGRRPVERPDAAGSIRARYVVGCDGANSTVRTLLGIGIDDRGFFYDWLIVDVVLDEPRVFDPPNLQVCDPARPTTAVSGGPGRRRWEFMRLPGERIEDLTHEARAWELLAPWGVHPGNARLERHALYTFQARVAAQWQVGRAFLAGDAAHQMPPFAGQGMCAGLRDAANLAWKLDLVLDGRVGAGLLATYDEERRPSASAAVDFSSELGTVVCVPDPAEAAARDESMAAAYDGGVSEAPGLPGIAGGLVASGAPLAGELFPQGNLGGRWFDDVHGVGWRLVTVDPDAAGLDPALAGWLGTIGGTVVDVAGAAEDLAAWFEAGDVRWALQRPDFHVFGTAADVASAAGLLADLRRQLAPAPTDRPAGRTS
jgi:flavoprotein hydroxylase